MPRESKTKHKWPFRKLGSVVFGGREIHVFPRSVDNIGLTDQVICICWIWRRRLKKGLRRLVVSTRLFLILWGFRTLFLWGRRECGVRCLREISSQIQLNVS